ncbi:hypothetical protein IMSHALPRED_003995 [Imshaugia aleurites]|uniref:Uncharacterized protein n=1 Tax=Imshaugia aleurites TaxID=172621 RepID=A0A8H3I3G9_9LECA|nr:hypothetical protein IMSHALPRED_003995 [Imshaugia aleurites]
MRLTFTRSSLNRTNVEVSLSCKGPRWGMPALLKTFDLPLPDYVYCDINALNVVEPDIIVSVTCEYDSQQIIKRLDFLFKRKKTYLICTAHYADEWHHEWHHEWVEPALMKWIEAGLLTIVTLSPNVQEAFHRPGWGFSPWESLALKNDASNSTAAPILWPPMDVFVPVFPLTNVPQNAQEDKREDISFAIRGAVADNGEYSRVVNYVADLQQCNSTSDNVSLHIIGSGRFDPSLRNSVHSSAYDDIFFAEDLDYMHYYRHSCLRSVKTIISHGNLRIQSLRV